MKNSYDVIFESERILYVKLTTQLIDDYLKMVNDPNVASKISHTPQTYTYNQEKEWVESKLKEDALCWSMLEKSTKEFIGNIEIMAIRNGIGELGISITSTKQNMHYGTEALETMLKYARDELKLKGLELNVYATNPRAIHCYEKVGFIHSGTGKTADDIHMEILF